MMVTRRALLALALVAAILLPNAAAAQTPIIAPELTAIDVLLDPDSVMLEHAQAANKRLLADNPKGFALDADHAPHITVVQRFVRTADLDSVYAAVAKVSNDESPTAWKLTATGYYDIPTGSTGLAGVVVEPTAELLRFQQRIIEAIAPYTVPTGTDAAFVPKPDGGTMVAGLTDYVSAFVPKSSGRNYNPHVTIGVGTRAYLDRLKAEPFKPFGFKARSVSVYQLGDFGTAQKLLWTSADQPASSDPLPSWNEGPNKKAILDFVAHATTDGSPDYVPPAERIAVFDNDGTLWAEQPMYFQLAFALDRVKALAPQHPEWQTAEPFASILKGDLKAALAGGEKSIAAIITASHAGMTTEEFNTIVKDWLQTARHPTTGRPYDEMVYQPMLDVLAYLRAHGFKTYIVSGGGVEFMRAFAEETYGIPPEQVIGSRGKTAFSLIDNDPARPVLTKLPDIDFIDDGPGKPVAINAIIGRRPIMAFGNSDGDQQMLQWTAAGAGPRFILLVHHTDAAREWAYDRESHIGKLDKALDEAAARNWTVVNIKTDWTTIFPPAPR